MGRFNGNRTPPKNSDNAGPNDNQSSERRRMGRIVHDDRGAASVEWRDVPDEFALDRPVLRVEGAGASEPLAIEKPPDTFNPYDRVPDPSGPPASKGGKRDLRKLSAWMKLMREMEERKKRGGD